MEKNCEEKIVNRKYNFELLIRIQRKYTYAEQIDKSSQYCNNNSDKRWTKTNSVDEEKNRNNKCIDAWKLCRQECEDSTPVLVKMLHIRIWKNI